MIVVSKSVHSRKIRLPSTFGIEAESMRQAKPRLNHIENDLLNNFRRLGVIATTMNGKERLHLMHSMFHMGDNDKFFFDWKYLVESGLSVKDFIARQEEGLMSSLPLGLNQVEIQRSLTTSAVAIFVCRLPRRSFTRTAVRRCTAV